MGREGVHIGMLFFFEHERGVAQTINAEGVPEIETTWADWNVEHECQCHTSFVLPFDLEYNDIGIFDMVCLFPIL